jgi:acetyl-CoA carboxylase carboxyltransferase component
MREAIEGVMDDGEFFEVQEGWAQNLVVGFARLDGHAVGVVETSRLSCRDARHRRERQGGAVRALL